MSERKSEQEKSGTSRRGFLKTAALTGAGLGALGALPAGAAEGEEAAKEKLPQVPRRELGKTGETVPILLFGCAQRFDPRYDRLLHRGFKEGVDYLDTALRYEEGQSHATLAPFVEQVGRDEVWITSKGPGQGADRVKAFESELDTCLEQLKVDRLDLYFMHALDDPAMLDAKYIEMGARMKKAGKTRFFGFSCHGDREVELLEKAAKIGADGIDAIMLRYNFRRYGELALNRALDACAKAGIGLIAMKTQGGVAEDAERVVAFQSKDFNLAQAKLKAVWADERIAAAVSHMDNTEKLRENVDAARSPVKLSMDDFQQLRQLATATAALACQGCSHVCESEVEGPVKIADSLRFLMYHEAYGEPHKARRLYGELPEEARAFERVDLSAAERACPQRIPIRARLTRARELLA